jgi:hypothetical protein
VDDCKVELSRTRALKESKYRRSVCRAQRPAHVTDFLQPRTVPESRNIVPLSFGGEGSIGFGYS